MLLITKYIQDESTSALVLYSIFSMIIGFLIVMWIRYNKKKAESDNEYYFDFFTDNRLYGAIIILIIGIWATVSELLKRF